MKTGKTILLLLAGLCLVQAASAQGVALTAKVSTLGPGLELTTALAPRLNARLGGHYFSYSRTDLITDLEIEVEAQSAVKLASASLVFDWLPFKKVLRLSGGFVYNLNEVHSVVTPMEEYAIEGKTFAPDRIGTLEGRVGHQSKFNPYVGLGLGNVVAPSKRLGIALDLGMLYTNSPRVEMEGTGMIAPTATQAPDVEADIASIKIYPMVSLGLSYKLF